MLHFRKKKIHHVSVLLVFGADLLSENHRNLNF